MGTQAFRFALKIRWRSLLEYFSIEKKMVEELRGAKGFRRAKISKAKIGFLKPKERVKRLFISSELL